MCSDSPSSADAKVSLATHLYHENDGAETRLSLARSAPVCINAKNYLKVISMVRPWPDYITRDERGRRGGYGGESL